MYYICSFDTTTDAQGTEKGCKLLLMVFRGTSLGISLDPILV